VETVSSDGVKIKGWFIYHDDPVKHKTIVYMHESEGNIGLRLDYFETIYHKLNANILIFAYRGYSRSEGNPTEKGIKKDADAIAKFISDYEYINKYSVFLVGRSLGGAVSIYTAAKYPDLFRGIVLENTFTSIPDMIDEHFFFAKYFKGLILNNFWTSIDLVSRIQKPMLFITGYIDEIVPR
jgi:pimeloyl-ACP methyl ester carboxylesterase